MKKTDDKRASKVNTATVILMILCMGGQPAMAQNFPPAYGQVTEAQIDAAPNTVSLPATAQNQQLVIPAKTRFPARIEQSLDSETSSPGDKISAVLEQPLAAEGVVLVPAGARLLGEIRKVVHAHRGFGANGKMELAFTQLVMADGSSRPILAVAGSKDVCKAAGGAPNRMAMTMKKASAGALTGAGAGLVTGVATGGLWGRRYCGPWGMYRRGPSYGQAIGYSTAIGAAAGLAGGLAAAALTRGEGIHVVEGTPLTCELKQDLEGAVDIAQAF